jgi:hypothetical protein
MPKFVIVLVKDGKKIRSITEADDQAGADQAGRDLALAKGAEFRHAEIHIPHGHGIPLPGTGG